MSSPLLFLLLLSLSGSVFALLTVMLRKLFWKQAPPPFWYYIWLLVILRFVLPLEGMLPLPKSALLVAAITQAAAESGEEAGISASQFPLDGEEPVSPGKVGPWAFARDKQVGPSISLLVFWLWAVVAAERLLASIASALFFQRTLREQIPANPPPQRITDIAGEAALQVGLSGIPAIRIQNRVPTPLQYGMRKPVILLPKHILGEDDTAIRHILIHELIHYRRRDPLYKWLVQLLVCIHWFNPLVYKIRRWILTDCELSCDAAVLGYLTAEERRRYGTMLLSVAAAYDGIPVPVGSVTLSADAKALKNRLSQIAGYGKRARPAAALSGCLAILLLSCGFAAGPSFRQESPLGDSEQAMPQQRQEVEEWFLNPDTSMPSSAEEQPVEDSYDERVDFSVIRQYFFGVWVSMEVPEFEWTIDESCMDRNLIVAAYLDGNGYAVMEVIHGGVLDRYRISPTEPDTIYSLGGDSLLTEFTPEFTRTGGVH